MANVLAVLERARRARERARPASSFPAPLLMGVVNVTPDSFFDGGRFVLPGAAEQHVDALIEQGADLIDIGGESSRPGAAPVPPGEQLARVEAALRHAVDRGALVSIDTTHPGVADQALRWGARIVNDVSCLADEELARVTAHHEAAIIITHCRGPMEKMPGYSRWPDRAYGDVVEDVLAEWDAARERACRAGVRREAVLFDPGLGFSKNARHSFELLRRLEELTRAGAPIVVGPGRKSFIASVDPAPPEQRLGGTLAACLLSAQRGADILRVHDVAPLRQALAVARAATEPPPQRRPSEVPRD